MRRAAKVDGNQPEIVAALRAAGVMVQHLHMVGMGCPDLLASWRGVNVLLEVKDGSLPPSMRRLTPMEVAWQEAWRGPVYTVLSPEDALAAMRDATSQAATVPFRGAAS